VYVGIFKDDCMGSIVAPLVMSRVRLYRGQGDVIYCSGRDGRYLGKCQNCV